MKCYKNKSLALIPALFLSAMSHAADTQLSFQSYFNLSDDQTTGVDDAYKTKLVRLGNGTLVSVFGNSADADKLVYDVKEDVERPARDIYIRTCPTASLDCSIEENWSAAVNVSNTATLSSISTDWQGDAGESSAYWGDSDKPNISNGGSNIMLTWTDKYCAAVDTDETSQRTVSYLVRDNREIPFSCTWARAATVSGSGEISWSTPATQLSDGSRDAKQDVSKVNSLGQAAVTWQEDPLGLQIGGAEGPGSGASGATASHGTDIWITTTTNTTSSDTVGEVTGFNDIARLTDNATETASGSYDVIKNAAGEIVDGDDIDGGNAAATRANTAIIGSNVVIAYEETKGSEGLAIGKFVRYHSVPFTQIPDDISDNVGCIISDPVENARRVRFMGQSSNLIATDESGIEDAGMRMGIIWKQGLYDQGGASDIMARITFNGVAATDMVPAVDSACAVSDYLSAENLANTPAYNLSSNTPDATSDNLSDTSETNNVENALAHRGAIVGNDLYIGYSYTSDWALAYYTTLENYDFWLRHYDATTKTWTLPKNISNLSSKELTVREPRIVKTPYTTSTTFGVYDPNAFVIAWGLQNNVYSHIESAQDLDIMYTRTFDKGETFETNVSVVNSSANSRFESQLRPTPDNQTLYAVWNEVEGDSTHAAAAVATTVAEGVTDEFTVTDSVYDTILATLSTNSTDTSVSDDTSVASDLSSSNDSSGGALGFWSLLALAVLGSLKMTKKRIDLK